MEASRNPKQSARLAKRVINLEKINIDLNREVAQLKNHNLKIKESLSNADKALDSVDQPYAYLGIFSHSHLVYESLAMSHRLSLM